MTTRFPKCGWQSGRADESVLSNCAAYLGFHKTSLGLESSQNHFEICRNRLAWTEQAAPSILPVYETHLGFKYIGESLDEDKTVSHKQDSVGFSFKSHYSKEDGIVATLLTAEATAACCPQLG